MRDPYEREQDYDSRTMCAILPEKKEEREGETVPRYFQREPPRVFIDAFTYAGKLAPTSSKSKWKSCKSSTIVLHVNSIQRNR